MVAFDAGDNDHLAVASDAIGGQGAARAGRNPIGQLQLAGCRGFASGFLLSLGRVVPTLHRVAIREVVRAVAKVIASRLFL